MRLRTGLAVLPLFLVPLAACASQANNDATSNDTPTATGSAGGSTSASASGSTSGSATPVPGGGLTPTTSCTTDKLHLVKSGQLTIATDSPAYDPWFSDNDPTNGKGYESAVAYAVAQQLGFSTDQVTWVEEVFNNSYKPGPKPFDFDINQISITPDRAQVVDFSTGYYTVAQGIVALKDNPIASATSLADLAKYHLGAQTGTTSLTAIRDDIKPSQDPGVYQSNNLAKQALVDKQIDGLVVDLPTAYYLTAAEIKGSTIVGQLPPVDGEQEQFGMLFQKGNPLVTCVDQALDALQAAGTLDQLNQQWLSSKTDVPVLQVTGPPVGGTGSWTPSPHEQQRRELRRRQGQQRVLLASVVTVVVLGALVAVVVLSPGWSAVRSYFFSVHHARGSFREVLKGFWINVRLFLICEPLILAFALLTALARSARSAWLTPVRLLAVVYTDVMRGIPTILLVTLLAFGMPALQLKGLPISPFFWAGVALVMSYVAYVAEVFRAGIDSIHPSQVQSATALGLSHAQALRFVVVPQAVRRVVPPLLNDFVSLQKDTALVSSVGIFDAMLSATDYESYHFNSTSLVVVAGFFIVCTVPLARLCDWLQRRWLERERAGAL